MDSSLLLSNNDRFQPLTGNDHANLAGRIQLSPVDPVSARTAAIIQKFPKHGLCYAWQVCAVGLMSTSAQWTTSG